VEGDAAMKLLNRNSLMLSILSLLLMFLMVE
jgi:hypothetical protein